jgi:phosphoglucomutase
MDLMISLRLRLPQLKDRRFGASRVSQCDDFAYTDPVDHTLAEHQGVRLVFSEDARIIYRLSGTGTAGATLRLYLERFEPDPSRHARSAQAVLADLAALAVEIAEVESRTGRMRPSVVT